MESNQFLHISRRLLLSCLPAFALFANVAHAEDEPLSLSLNKGAALPEEAIENQIGRPFTRSGLAGMPVLLNFWASWCAPCITELPHLEEAAQKLAPFGIKIVLVGLDRDGAEIGQKFLQKRGVKTPLTLYDPKWVWARHVRVQAMPTSLLIKADKSEYASYTGPAEWHRADIIKQVKDYLA